MARVATEMESDAMVRWRVTLIACVAVFTVLLLLFHSTVESMVAIWYEIETYTHGFVILPLSLWLIWHKRAHLAAYTPQPTAALMLFVVGSLVIWSLARLIGVQVIEQLSLVALLITSVATLIGWQVAKFLAFPLLFLLFAVPMGEDLVPPMMEYTATFTVTALKLTGIPVYRDGLWFSVPSGNWSVVEACSGVRYLIASITLGVMYAYITYHTLWKRLLFVVLSAAVPIFANGVRAYMIVMIGHLSDMKYAVGVDHLIYGWVFFGFVMFLLFWIGSYWQEEEEPPEHVVPPRALTAGVGDRRVTLLAVSILLISSMALWATQQAENVEVQMAGSFVAPAQAGGWRKSTEPPLWKSGHLDSAHAVAASYQSGNDVVQLYVALFPRQRQGSEAINSGNQIARKLVRLTPLGSPPVSLGQESVAVNQSRAIVEQDDLYHEHMVWQWYRVVGHSLTNRYEGKVREALARVYPGRADGVWIAITTRVDTEDEASAKQRLADFAETMTPQLYADIDRALGYAE